MKRGAALAAALLLPASPAAARDLCAERPGLGTPACTVDTGHVQIELGIGDWTRDRDEAERIDSVQVASQLVRVGLTHQSEFQLGWTPFAHQWTRDADGRVERVGGADDLRIGLKQNLANPDGHHLSVAVLPFAVLPIGRTEISRGDWEAGLLMPLTYDLTDAIQLEFTPEIDALVDEDRQGHHLGLSGVVGAEFDLIEDVELTTELMAVRDQDPADHSTAWQVAMGLAWQPSRHLQLDMGAVAALEEDAPDIRLYAGVSALF